VSAWVKANVLCPFVIIRRGAVVSGRAVHSSALAMYYLQLLHPGPSDCVCVLGPKTNGSRRTLILLFDGAAHFPTAAQVNARMKIGSQSQRPSSPEPSLRWGSAAGHGGLAKCWNPSCCCPNHLLPFWPAQLS